MKYYPIFLRVAHRPCLVVGGGRVAQHKVESLLNAGASVTVVSPTLTAALEALVTAGRVTHWRRPYTVGDVHGFVLAYAAAGDAAVDRQVVADAERSGSLVNVVDQPTLCDFIAPAVFDRGDLIIATSSSGASPALSKRIRRDLEAMFGDEYAEALQVLKRLRERLMAEERSPAERRRIFTVLAESALLDLLRQQNYAAVDRLLADTAGDDISLSSLGMTSS